MTETEVKVMVDAIMQCGDDNVLPSYTDFKEATE